MSEKSRRRGQLTPIAERVKWARAYEEHGNAARVKRDGGPSFSALKCWLQDPEVRAILDGVASTPAAVTPRELPAPVRTRGRVSKLEDDQVRAEFFRGLELCLSYDHCAALAGVHPTTVRNWLHAAHDKAASGDDSAWGAEILRAEARGLLQMHDRIAKGDGGWQGSAWLLERRKGYRAKVEVTEDAANAVDSMTDEELDAILATRPKKEPAT